MRVGSEETAITDQEVLFTFPANLAMLRDRLASCDPSPASDIWYLRVDVRLILTEIRSYVTIMQQLRRNL